MEYRIGVAARSSNPEETIARWRESMRDFSGGCSSDWRNRGSRISICRRELVGLLMADAKAEF